MFELSPPDVQWSVDVSPADWLGDRLVDFAVCVNSVVPSGFEEYVRFDHSEEGTIPSDVLETLLDVLSRHTTSADVCFFCVWDGFAVLHGGRAVGLLHIPSGVVTHPEGIVPQAIRGGPRVRLPQRDYYLFAGALDDARALSPWHITPNIWWPEDGAWCVASEIDLPWTYVGGTRALVDELRDVLGARTTRGTDPIIEST